MNEDEMVPATTVVCGVGGGKGRPHGLGLAVVALRDGRLVHSDTQLRARGRRFLVETCAKHRLVAVSEDTIRAAI